MKKLMAIVIAVVLCCTCIAMPAMASADDWRLQNATEVSEGHLTMGQENGEAVAYYVAKETEDAWKFNADVDVAGYNGGAATFSFVLASGDVNSLGVASLLNFGIWNSEQYQMYQIWYDGFQQAGANWENRNGDEPAGGAEENKKALTSRVFNLAVEKKAGENCLHVVVKAADGSTKLNFTTGELDAAVMESVSYIGVRTWSGDAKVNNFNLVNASEEIVLPPPEGGWKLQNATEIGKGYLTMGQENAEATAYYVSKEANDAWKMTANVDVAGYNGNMATFSVALASGDADSLSTEALLNFGIWNSEQYQMYQIWYDNFQQASTGWENRNGDEPAGGAEENKKALTSRVFNLTVEKKSGENCLHVIVKDTDGATKLNFVTGNLDAEVMDRISHVGIRTWSGNAQVSNFAFTTASDIDNPKTGDVAPVAACAVAMALSAAMLIVLVKPKFEMDQK